ncbi:hypothetical protein N7539_007557 [Penicillium diatomitis]|uniref:Zn(2)-C6 fungal-type domain-containing protein n=1 Tax=Penicillium diatomitis TaxID=2819901 RepID=A0A9X0BP43_9EURO|nr:uncharacterized protein N7539_007557 [Penicillium diatomitis]KAJ5477413.1 hypothetical protein N7539_007557 [Penicillium diatomitis]
MSLPTASPEGPKSSSAHGNSPTGARAGVSATAPHPGPEAPNARSCITCRRRKVRCNKRSPCSNCVRAGVDCVFPPPGRAPRKSKRPPDSELLSRLRRLEGVIEHLNGAGAKSSGRTASITSLSPTQIAADQAPVSFATAPAPATLVSASAPAPAPARASISSAITASPEPTTASNSGCPFENDPKAPVPKNFENEFGRLVIDEGKSRYVSNRLWASLGDEIEELQDILDHSSSEEEDYPSPHSSHSGSHDGFLFGYYTLSHSLREFHPLFPRVSLYWEVYRENVAPLVTIVHLGTARNLLIEAAQNPDSLDKNNEALVFAIYLSAIISLTAEQCLSRFGEERATLIKQYRFAVEQALSRAGMLNTQSLVLIQAAVLFLICIRREDDSKFVWSMTAVIVRLAQGLGLHRDGTNFALKPFETEMRRRLWWHICLLDARSSDDHGTDSQINESMYDTRLPLNINDDDITPEATEPPKEREGVTDVTFCLVRCEIACALRRANYGYPDKGAIGPVDGGAGMQRCERMIRIISDRIEQRYVKHCDMKIPIQWAIATVARLVLAKLWLSIHHPMTSGKRRAANVSQATRESLFLTAIEVLEFGRLLETDPRTAKWGWMYRTNMQWYGIAFVLSEVCVRPICPVTDRAWNAVQGIYLEWSRQATHKKGMLWRPLAALMKRATAIRAKQQHELFAKFGPQQPPFFADPNDYLRMHRHSLPQIHMPESTSVPASVPSSDSQSALNEADINVDLSQGPWETLQSIFPDTNILAPVDLEDPLLRGSFAGVDAPANLSFTTPTVNNGSSNDGFNTGYNNTSGSGNGNSNGKNDHDLTTQIEIPPTTNSNWDEWDQVMRDFQLDVENEGLVDLGKGTHVSTWFA